MYLQSKLKRVINKNHDIFTLKLHKNQTFMHKLQNTPISFSLGGKWTTYRSMAKDAVDAAIKTCNLQPKNDSLTDGLLLEGSHGWTPNMFIRLVQDFGLDDEVRCIYKHLW